MNPDGKPSVTDCSPFRGSKNPIVVPGGRSELVSNMFKGFIPPFCAVAASSAWWVSNFIVGVTLETEKSAKLTPPGVELVGSTPRDAAPLVS